jgi:glycosyltransferase involved in cell wall biosynthesis
MPYVLITPAHNEEAYIERAIRSVALQTVPPMRWVVVNDSSQDCTAAIVEKWRACCPFIQVVELRREPGRHFGHKAHAFAAGVNALGALEYEYIGNLDADITIPPNYYERLLEAFGEDSRLGIVGGMVRSYIGHSYTSQRVAPDSVAGAVQFFRRACLESVGGYPVLPLGGIDAAVEILARKNGWKVRTFAEIDVQEHRPTGSATNPMRARMREGHRLHSLGYAFSFFLARAFYRAAERPPVLGSLAAVAGFTMSSIKGAPIVLAPDVVAFLRREQRAKLLCVGKHFLRHPLGSTKHQQGTR